MAAPESAAKIEAGNPNTSTQLTILRKADMPIPRSVINYFGDCQRIVPSKVLGSQCLLCLQIHLTVENFSAPPFPNEYLVFDHGGT
ncbi:MAG: hypothetical protein WBW36_12380, partial [Candidatus Sulfotelmatobacter sp.]